MVIADEVFAVNRLLQSQPLAVNTLSSPLEVCAVLHRRVDRLMERMIHADNDKDRQDIKDMLLDIAAECVSGARELHLIMNRGGNLRTLRG